MSPPYVNVTEATGDVSVVAPNVDSVAAFLGTASDGPTFDPHLFARPDAVNTYHAEGPGVRAINHSLKRSKIPASFMRLPSTNDGYYEAVAYSRMTGSLEIPGKTGTAVVTVDETSLPLNDFDGYMICTRDGAIGATGANTIKFKHSRSGGRKLSGEYNLGAAVSFTIPQSGIKLDLDAPEGALIAAATNARSMVLAHLADTTIHNSADTSAEQVALAASSVPTTNAEAWAIVELAIEAFEAHRDNSTVHTGPDPRDAITAAEPVNAQSGISGFLDLKAKFNAHMALTLGSSTNGLKAATATVASAVTLTTSDLLSGGRSTLASFARRLRFTTAGTTASDAPATATITGTDYSGEDVVEVLSLAQSATSVVTVHAFKTIESIVYTAADGTGATITIGYAGAGHTSLDLANIITAASPDRGTLKKGDVIRCRSHGPKWSVDDLTAGFDALAESGIDPSMVYIAGEMSASEAAAVTNGLDTLLGQGKRCAAVVYTREQIRSGDDAESELEWIDAITSDFATFFDDRIMVCAGTAWVTDPNTSDVWDMTFAHAVMARLVSIDRFVSPSEVALGTLPGVALTNSAGKRVGHDESWIGGLDEARFCVLRRLPDPGRRNGTYISHPFVMKDAEGRVSQFQVRRVAQAAERSAASVGFGMLGSDMIYDSETNLLDETVADAITAKYRDVIAAEFANDISNANDPNLVEVSREGRTEGDDVFFSVTIHLMPLKYVGGIDITFDLKV